MMKEPRAGGVKTRLARQVGQTAAVGFYRNAARAVVRRLAASRRWQTWLAVAPDTAVHARCWQRVAGLRAQGRGDLGQRMQRIMGWPGSGPIIIVGTDIPAIRPLHIARAFSRLAGSDAVLGPTPDGGYWLVGLRRAPRIRTAFGNVRWSSPHALADTHANLAGARVAFADTLCDVDTADDWRAARAWSGRIVLPAELFHASESAHGTRLRRHG